MLIADVIVSPERRALRDVTTLAKSIADIGLLQPIVVTADGTLVAGLHRLHACKSLGWTDIPAHVVQLDALRAELAEIDENLIRNELSALERGEAMVRRKEIYLALYPETRHGGDRRSVKPGKQADQAPESGTCRVPAFSDDLALKTGRSRQAIDTDIRVASRLPEELRDRLRGTDAADNQIGLIGLSRLPAEELKELAKADVETLEATVKREGRKANLGKKHVESERKESPKPERAAKPPMVVTKTRVATEHVPTLEGYERLLKNIIPDLERNDSVRAMAKVKLLAPWLFTPN